MSKRRTAKAAVNPDVTWRVDALFQVRLAPSNIIFLRCREMALCASAMHCVRAMTDTGTTPQRRAVTWRYLPHARQRG